MVFLVRLLLAQNLVHLFEGMTLGDWLGLLRRERFRVDPVCWPRAAWITGMSAYVVDPSDPFPDGFTVGDIW